MRTGRSPLAAVLVVAASVAIGCGVGGDEGGTGARAINWYVFNEPGGAYDQAVAKKDRAALAALRTRLRTGLDLYI